MVSADVDFSQIQKLGNEILTQLDGIREEKPIYWSEKQQAWIVTGHAQVTEALRGELPFSVNRLPRMFTFMPDPEERERRIPYVMQTFSRMLLSLDPPRHARLRQLLMKAFSRPVMEVYRPYARQVISEVIEETKARGSFDYVEHVARLIPSRVIVRLMGLTDDYVPRLRYWAWATLSGAGGGGTTKELMDETQKAFLQMREAFMNEIAARRAKPQNDFISTLISAEVGGERLEDEDIVATCIMSLTAGHDTTGNTLGLGSLALARNPQAWDAFRNLQGDSLLNAVMELQRCIGMSTTQGRVVVKDFEWRGFQFKAGQIVYLMVASANRDPQAFPHPEVMDFNRPQANNVVFGPGMHHCIGHLLAKMQLTEFFPRLVEAFSGMEILDEKLNWNTVVGFRGLQSLNVRMIPRAAH